MSNPARALVSVPSVASHGPRLESEEALARIRRFLEDWRMRAGDNPGSFVDFEKELHAKIMEFEREMIAEQMARADVDVGAIVVDGTTYRRVVRCQETYFTAAGPVQVLRTLYKNRSEEGERAISPMELRLGVVEGRWTPLAAQQAVWVVAQLTPLRAEELFARIGNMTPSKSSLDRLPKAMSARWETERAQFEKALRDGDVIPQHAVTVAVSLDGVLAPMRDGDAQKKREKTAEEGRLTRGPAGYREVGCGTLSFCDTEGDMISAVRIARMPETKKATLKRTLLSDVTAALAERPDLRLVKIADGALDNWTFLANEVPGGVEILDFYHAVEHLDGALGSVYGEGTVEARKRFAALRFVLQEEADGAEKIIRALDYLHKRHAKNARVTKELAYFRNNRHRMRYHEFAAEGLPIGSGVVEAACKTLVTQRMKQSGMRWDEAGGQAILTVRGWTQSGDRFDRAWALLAATYQAEVVLLHNVVPFPPGGRQKGR
ncbi:MAG: hypothetical protein ABI134_33550 [Byssovorax sp.]